jgi:hypothetical protein
VIEVIKLYSNRAFGFMELGNRGTGTSNAKYIIGKTATRRKGNEMVGIQLGKGFGTLKFERVYTNQTPSITIDPNMHVFVPTMPAENRASIIIGERVLAGISLVLDSDEGPGNRKEASK